MSPGGPERARAVASALLATCLPAGMRADDTTVALPAAVPVAETFRCWTPFRDWQQGSAGVESLRQALAGFCALLPGGSTFRPSALIAGDAAVVVEAVTPVAGEAVSMTLVLTLDSDLASEARCYVDPRAVDVTAALSAGGQGDTGRN